MRVRVDKLEDVKAILMHHEVYKYTTEDGDVGISDDVLKALLESDLTYFLMPNSYTVAMFVPMTRHIFTMHIGIVPEGRGKVGFEAGKKVIRWIFENTECLKIVGTIPCFNKRTLFYAMMLGFKVEGLIKECFLKNNHLYDMWLVGKGGR